MKKIALFIITLAIALIMIPVVKAEDTVKVYMFTKNGCPACESANEYFTGLLEDEPDLFELVTLEVWSGADSNGNWIVGNDDLYQLITKVYEHYNETEMATPTIVIGDYHTIGLPQNTDTVKEEIEKARDSKEKVDVVKDLADDLGIDLETVANQSATTNEDTEKSGKYDAIIIVGIFVILIGGFAGLVIMGKK